MKKIDFLEVLWQKSLLRLKVYIYERFYEIVIIVIALLPLIFFKELWDFEFFIGLFIALHLILSRLRILTRDTVLKLVTNSLVGASILSAIFFSFLYYLDGIPYNQPPDKYIEYTIFAFFISFTGILVAQRDGE